MIDHLDLLTVLENCEKQEQFDGQIDDPCERNRK